MRPSASLNRTGSRTCLTMSCRRSAPAGSTSPVTVDSTRRASGRNRQPARYASSPAAAGATAGEWNACETAIGAVARPIAAAAARTRSTLSAGPETTLCRGPLYPAMTTGSVPSRASTCSGPASIPAMAPPPSLASAMTRPRALARSSSAASSIAPAQWSAVSSPRL